MLESIRSWGEATDGVCAAILTGSRARRGARVDVFSDYDVALFLSDPAALEADSGWYAAFGDVLVAIPTASEHFGRRVAARLVTYSDGSRIDFTLFPVDMLRVLSILPELPPWLDAGYRVLFDEGDHSGMMVPPHGRGYSGRVPEAAVLIADVNEFLWEAALVAKQLARGEAVAAAYSAEVVMRYGLLLRMLEHLGHARSGWTRAPGPTGRGLQAQGPEFAVLFEAPRIGAEHVDGWAELDRLLSGYGAVAREVFERSGAVYPAALEARVRARIADVKTIARG